MSAGKKLNLKFEKSIIFKISIKKIKINGDNNSRIIWAVGITVLPSGENQ